MYVETVPNRNSPPAILLRESFREGSQVRKRTLANISDWPASQIESLRRVLKGETFQTAGTLDIIRSLPHGHVAAVLGTIRKAGLGHRHDRDADSGATIEVGHSSRSGFGNRDQQPCRYTPIGIGHRG